VLLSLLVETDRLESDLEVEGDNESEA
jgi:hypothetical protein